MLHLLLTSCHFLFLRAFLFLHVSFIVCNILVLFHVCNALISLRILKVVFESFFLPLLVLLSPSCLLVLMLSFMTDFPQMSGDLWLSYI